MKSKLTSKIVAIGMMIAGVSVYYGSRWINMFKKSIDVDVDITNDDIEENLGI